MRTRGLALAWALVLAAGPSSGEEPSESFSRARRHVVTLDGIAGLVRQRFQTEGAPKAWDTTHLGVFSSYLPPTYPLTRLGFHEFIYGPLSIGFEVHYSDNDDVGHSFLAAPRAGIVLGSSPLVAWWLRGGVAYVSQGSDVFADWSLRDVRPGLQLDGVFTTVEHLRLLVGLRGEIGVAGRGEAVIENDEDGSLESTTTEFDYLEAGLVVGVLVDF